MDATATPGGVDHHALDLAVRFIQHDRATAKGDALFISCNDKNNIGFGERREVKRITRLSRIQRILIRIEICDERYDIWLIRGLLFHTHTGS